MTTHRFLQLDVFAPRPGTGNPLAVVLDADGLDDAAMQAIARWTRLPETTFVFTPTAPGSSYRIRMFAPQKEVPFAGHPSVGSAHAALECGLATPVAGLLVQDGIAGQDRQCAWTSATACAASPSAPHAPRWRKSRMPMTAAGARPSPAGRWAHCRRC